MFEEKKKQLLQLRTELGKRQKNLQKDFTKPHSSDSGKQSVEREMMRSLKSRSLKQS